MNKVKIKKIPFKLLGEAIEKNKSLVFKAVDQENKEVSIDQVKGLKVLSFFPDINTGVCDMQTLKIGSLAKEHPNINFVSITMDSPEEIKKWCMKNDLANLVLWSDAKYKEFQTKTNLYIPRIKKLSRGLIVLDENNIIVDKFFNIEIAEQPDWTVLDKYL